MKKYKLSKIQGENESPDPLLSKTQVDFLWNDQ